MSEPDLRSDERKEIDAGWAEARRYRSELERAEAEAASLLAALDNSQSLFVATLVEQRPSDEIEQQIIENRAALAKAPATAENLHAQLATKDARIAECLEGLEHSNARFIAAEARVAELEADQVCDAWLLTRAEQAEAQLAEANARITSLEKSVTDARDALMTNPITQPEVSFLRNARKAALAILDAALAQAGDAASRITSLEKSVTVLRAENVELREIAGGLSYYADGHGLQEKWAAELRSFHQRLGALAQATDQPAPRR